MNRLRVTSPQPASLIDCVLNINLSSTYMSLVPALHIPQAGKSKAVSPTAAQENSSAFTCAQPCPSAALPSVPPRQQKVSPQLVPLEKATLLFSFSTDSTLDPWLQMGVPRQESLCGKHTNSDDTTEAGHPYRGYCYNHGKYKTYLKLLILKCYLTSLLQLLQPALCSTNSSVQLC